MNFPRRPSPNPLLTFGIPLKASRDALEWSALCKLLSATLRSIYNQTDGDFQIMLACDRKPDIDFVTDKRLEFMRVALPTPSDHDDGNNDAGTKRWEIARRFVKAGGGYIMYLDADDLVSNRLVRYVRETRHPSGYIFEMGYGLDAGSQKILPIPQLGVTDALFHQMCGSSTIIRFVHGDLSPRDGQKPRYNRLFKGGHTTVAAEAEAEGRPMLKVPFRPAVYVVGTSVSQSAVRAGEESDFAVERENWIRTLAASGVDVATIGEEFGLNYRGNQVPPPPLPGRWKALFRRLRRGG